MKVALSIVLTLLAFPSAALAWGRDGHAIVADLAEAQLTPGARAEVVKLLAIDGARHLSDVSEWADGAKGGEDSPSHTIRLHLQKRVGPDPCGRNFCILRGIDQYSRQLADRNLPPAQREIALKYIVHLIGDIHQPLHCVMRRDSRTPVIFRGKEQTLHGVYDRGIIYAQHRSEAQIVSLLSGGRSLYPTGGDPLSWAVESRDMAREQIFNDITPAGAVAVVLPPDYAARHWPLVAQRLTQGGARLASTLNRLLG